MYEGNGVTTEFPLPSGADGKTVVWTSPTGAATRLKENDAYTVRDGTVFFSAPPPAGYTVSFEMPESLDTVGKSYLVLYPDGSIHAFSEDPWISAVETKTLLNEAKNLLAETRKTTDTALQELATGVSETKKTLSELALEHMKEEQSSIAAAARAAAMATKTHLEEDMVRILRIRDETAAMKDNAAAALTEAEKAAGQIAEQAENRLNATLQEAKGEIRAIREDIDATLEDAKEFSEAAAAQTAGKIENCLKETLDKVTGLQTYVTGMRSGISDLYDKTAAMAEKVSRAMNEAQYIKEVAERVRNDMRALEDGQKKIAESEERVENLVSEAAARFSMRRQGATLRRTKGETADNE
jgi:hypothetical protein